PPPTHATTLSLHDALPISSYTYLDWDTAAGKLARRPRHRGNLNLNYLYERFQVNLGANFIGRHDDNDSVTAANITKPGYVKFDRSEEHTSELQSLAYLVCR